MLAKAFNCQTGGSLFELEPPKRPLLDLLASRVAQIKTGDPWWHRAIQHTGAEPLPLESPQRRFCADGRTAVLLAGGVGRRLFPVTDGLNKHLLPVAGQPAIFYPLANVMAAGATNVVIVTSPRDVRPFQEILGYGESLGINIAYRLQDKPSGTSVALTCAEDLVGGKAVILTFGDTIILGRSWQQALKSLPLDSSGATIFGLHAPHIERYALTLLSRRGAVDEIIEKPERDLGGLVTPGFYLFDENALSAAFEVDLNKRGERDTPSMVQIYQRQGNVKLVQLGSEAVFFDTGHPDTIAEAHEHIKGLREQNPWVGDPHAVALGNNFISRDSLRAAATRYGGDDSRYGNRLLRLMGVRSK